MSVVPRPYQQELLEMAKESNTICVLPTGSGKTLVACLLISYVKSLDKSAGKKTLFLVPTRPLVVQQKEYIEKYLAGTNENYSVGAYGSNGADIITIDEDVDSVSGVNWKSRDIYVSTSQVVLNALHHSDLRIEDIDLIVFDECHHARRDNPYRLLMSEFYKRCDPKTRPRILGLTASVVLTLKAFETEMRDLELNLDAKIKIAKSFTEKEGAQVAIYTYENNLPKLEEKAPVSARCASDIGDWCQDLLDQLKSPANSNITEKPMSIWEMYTKECDGALLLPALPEDLSGLTNKARLLIETMEEWSMVDASKFKGIIFCKERLKAVLLSLLLLRASKTNPKLKYVRLSPFMSHSNMPKSVQSSIISKFRRGEINTIISTSVLEEGLDVPECNVVIRYDLDETIKSMIQSKGRARAENSVFILLCSDDDPKKDRYTKELEGFYSTVSNTESVETDRIRARQIRQEIMAAHVYEVPSTKSKVAIQGAKAILSEFLNVRLGNCTKDAFKYNDDDLSLEIPEESDADVCRVSLERDEIVSSLSWKKLLNLKLVRELHEHGDLDDYLKPVKYDKRTLMEEMAGIHSHSYGTLKSAPFYIPKVLRMPWKRVDASGVELYSSYKYEVFVLPDFSAPEWKHGCTLFRERDPGSTPHAKGRRRMCLLTPDKLDPAIEKLDFLGNEGKYKKKLIVRYMGEGPLLTPEHIQIGNKFNIWAFSEWKKENAKCNSSSKRVKHYFLLPFHLNEDAKDEVDWERAADVVLYNETYSKAYLTRLENGGEPVFINKPSAVIDMNKRLSKETLLYTPYSNPRGVFGPRYISKTLTPLSYLRPTNIDNPDDDDGTVNGENNLGEEYVEEEDDVEETSSNNEPPKKAFRGWSDKKGAEMTYKEYYYKRYKLGITDETQKLIHSARGDMVPELCRIFPLRRAENGVVDDVKKRMWRVEFALSCIEFMANPAFYDEFSGLTIEEFARAFTSTSASTASNYENLEFFGDTAVKFCVVTNLFFCHPKAREKVLVKHKNVLVSNRMLAEHAQEIGLDALIVSGCSSNSVGWVSPSSVNLGERTLGLKTVADVFEAVTGLSSTAPFCMECSDDKDLFLTTWDKARDHLYRFGLREVGTFDQIRRDMEDIISTQYTTDDLRFLMERANVSGEELYTTESRLRYMFRNKALLCEALIHESCSIGRGYQRLEFLGDAVIDALVTQYLFRCYPEMSPYVYSELRRSVVQNTSLAWVVVANKLHPFLHFRQVGIKETLEKYVISLRNKGYDKPAYPPLSPWEDLGSPKIFGDLFESLAGAIYLDARGDMTIVNEVILPFLMPLLARIKDPNDPDISPSSKMTQRLQSLGLFNEVDADTSLCKNGNYCVGISLKNRKSKGGDDGNDDEYIFKVTGESTTRQMAQFNAAKKVLEWLDEHKDFVEKYTKK